MRGVFVCSRALASLFKSNFSHYIFMSCLSPHHVARSSRRFLPLWRIESTVAIFVGVEFMFFSSFFILLSCSLLSVVAFSERTACECIETTIVLHCRRCRKTHDFSMHTQHDDVIRFVFIRIRRRESLSSTFSSSSLATTRHRSIWWQVTTVSPQWANICVHFSLSVWSACRSLCACRMNLTASECLRLTSTTSSTKSFSFLISSRSWHTHAQDIRLFHFDKCHEKRKIKTKVNENDNQKY